MESVDSTDAQVVKVTTMLIHILLSKKTCFTPALTQYKTINATRHYNNTQQLHANCLRTMRFVETLQCGSTQDTNGIRRHELPSSYKHKFSLTTNGFSVQACFQQAAPIFTSAVQDHIYQIMIPIHYLLYTQISRPALSRRSAATKRPLRRNAYNQLGFLSPTYMHSINPLDEKIKKNEKKEEEKPIPVPEDYHWHRFQSQHLIKRKRK